MQNRIQYQFRKDEDEIIEIAREGDGPKHLCDKEYQCPLEITSLRFDRPRYTGLHPYTDYLFCRLANSLDDKRVLNRSRFSICLRFRPLVSSKPLEAKTLQILGIRSSQSWQSRAHWFSHLKWGPV